MTKVKSIGIWILILVLAVPMAAAGAAKLASVEALHQSFALLGLPSWFGYFIGLCELLGAIGLLIPRLSSLAASGILIIMIGAMYFHINHPPLEQIVPAIVFAVLAISIAVIRKKDSILSA